MLTFNGDDQMKLGKDRGAHPIISVFLLFFVFAVLAPATGYAWQQAIASPYATPPRPPPGSALFNCAYTHNHPALLGWCKEGTVIAPAHLTHVNTMDNFYGLAQLGVVLTVHERAATLVQLGWLMQNQELFTLAQVGIRDTSAEVYSLVQFNLLNWQSRLPEREDCPKNSSCNQSQRTRQGSFAGGTQLGLFNRSAFAGAVQLGVFGNISDDFAGGLQIGGFNMAENFAGLGQLGLVNVVDEMAFGIQLGLGNYADDEMAGVQLGVVNLSDDDYFGLQIGAINITDDDIVGAQVSLLNVAKKVQGVQIGLVNWTRRLEGIQIGLVNVVKKSMFPVLPLVNISL